MNNKNFVKKIQVNAGACQQNQSLNVETENKNEPGIPREQYVFGDLEFDESIFHDEYIWGRFSAGNTMWFPSNDFHPYETAEGNFKLLLSVYAMTKLHMMWYNKIMDDLHNCMTVSKQVAHSESQVEYFKTLLDSISDYYTNQFLPEREAFVNSVKQGINRIYNSCARACGKDLKAFGEVLDEQLKRWMMLDSALDFTYFCYEMTRRFECRICNSLCENEEDIDDDDVPMVEEACDGCDGCDE